MTDCVLVERHGNVAIVTMNLPAKRNALGTALYPQLADTLSQLQDDVALRAMVLSGGRQFCAGGDLDGLDEPALEVRRGMQYGQRIVRMLSGGPLPVVAAVEGSAFGAGFSIALACDFIVADVNTKFCAAFGRVGLTPDYGLLWSLPQRVGIGMAREIVMLCDQIDGSRGRDLGLVDRLCEVGKVPDTALALAQRLALAPPGSISTTKAVLSRQPLSLDTILAWEADTQAMLVRSDDFREGILSFHEKRPPAFTGR